MLEPIEQARAGIYLLKLAVYNYLKLNGNAGLTNAEIGKNLGIYMGHARHQGHISRTILALLEKEGKVFQDKDSKRWFPCSEVEESI